MGGYKYLIEVLGLQCYIKGILNASGKWWYQKWKQIVDIYQI